MLVRRRARARITPPDIGRRNNFTPFLVSSAMNLAKFAGEPASTVAAHSARRAFAWGSSKPGSFANGETGDKGPVALQQP
jgi:hypothetical protein